MLGDRVTVVIAAVSGVSPPGSPSGHQYSAITELDAPVTEREPVRTAVVWFWTLQLGPMSFTACHCASQICSQSKS